MRTPKTGTALVARAALEVSASPAAEVAAAALDAQKAAGLERASFVLVAVEADRLADVAAAVDAALLNLA